MLNAVDLRWAAVQRLSITNHCLSVARVRGKEAEVEKEDEKESTGLYCCRKILVRS
jgi:hypothetical protein